MVKACKLALVAWFVVSLQGCTHGIRIMGIDNFGEKILKVPKDQYVEKVGSTLAQTHDAAMSSINELSEANEQGWELAYIRVGIALEGTVGIANIVTVGAAPRIRMWFTRPSRAAGQ